MKAHYGGGPRLLSHCVFSGVTCLNLYHVIIMKEFQFFLHIMVIQNPKKFKISHFFVSYNVMLEYICAG